MRVYLTGFMGAGKTTVGKLLAETLGWPFVDLDQEVENRTGMTIAAIFETEGEEAFRRLEREELLRTLELADAVIATGGGTITREENRRWLGENGSTVWLNPAFATICRHLGGEGKRERPLFRDEEEFLRLYRSRLEAYGQSDFRLDIQSDEELPEIVSRLALLLRHELCAT